MHTEPASIESSSSNRMAIAHWDETPLFLPEDARYERYPWLYNAAEFTKHRGERVLEVGCGAGSDLLQFAKHGADAWGMDITPAHLRLARERVGRLAQVEFGDATQIPFEDASFDFVYSIGVLHHIDQPDRVAKEILRVLRPGGAFKVLVYNRWSHVPLILMFQHGWNWKLWIENSRAPVHIDLYSKKMLRRLFSPIPLHFQKYECIYAPKVAPFIGWFLAARGIKPR
jgi:ubiquinone/menaquinone biosynthesis C-methylase UbiE